MKPLLFRFHRGGLEESMQTVIEIKSFEQLLITIIDGWDINPTKVEIKPYIYDERIHWDTHFVIIHVGESNYPVGYLNRKPDWSVKDYE
jgi:hypothetical protein